MMFRLYLYTLTNSRFVHNTFLTLNNCDIDEKWTGYLFLLHKYAQRTLMFPRILECTVRWKTRLVQHSHVVNETRIVIYKTIITTGGPLVSTRTDFGFGTNEISNRGGIFDGGLCD